MNTHCKEQSNYIYLDITQQGQPKPPQTSSSSTYKEKKNVPQTSEIILARDIVSSLSNVFNTYQIWYDGPH